jgi:hypothetical protein
MVWVVVVEVVVVVGKCAWFHAGMNTQAANFAQLLKMAVVIWAFSQRGELAAARRGSVECEASGKPAWARVQPRWANSAAKYT